VERNSCVHYFATLNCPFIPLILFALIRDLFILVKILNNHIIIGHSPTELILFMMPMYIAATFEVASVNKKIAIISTTKYLLIHKLNKILNRDQSMMYINSFLQSVIRTFMVSHKKIYKIHIYIYIISYKQV